MIFFIFQTDDKDLSIDVFNVMKKCMTALIDNSDIQLICCGAIVYISDNNGMY